MCIRLQFLFRRRRKRGCMYLRSSFCFPKVASYLLKSFCACTAVCLPTFHLNITNLHAFMYVLVTFFLHLLPILIFCLSFYHLSLFFSNIIGGFRTGPLHPGGSFSPAGSDYGGVRHTRSISSLGSDHGSSSSSSVNSKRRSPPMDAYGNSGSSSSIGNGGHSLKSRAERVPSSTSTSGKANGGVNRGNAPLKSLVAVPDHLKPPAEVGNCMRGKLCTWVGAFAQNIVVMFDCFESDV